MINPIILVTFITVSLDPEVIKTIYKIYKPYNVKKMAIK